MPHNTSDWAKVHTSFTLDGAGSTEKKGSKIQESEKLWRNRQIDMLHGHLIEDNAFFGSHHQNKIHILHGTSNLDAIRSSGVLYASAGCLVGAVYGAQVFPEGNRFRMHNLGDYILHHEVPSILAANNQIKRDSSLLLIELTVPENTNRQRSGVDYLKMGSIHYDLYNSLQHLLSTDERNIIEKKVSRMVNRSMDFLVRCNELYIRDEKLGLSASRNFIDALNTAAVELPMLGYLYFEAVSEFLMLNSSDDFTIELAKKKEFNNWLYKRLMYGIYRDLRGNFSISKFNPSVKELDEYVHSAKSKHQLSINLDELIMYTAERIVFWVNARFFNDLNLPITSGKDLSFEELSDFTAPLIGHAIHRQLREHDRYKEFYFYFDHMKALEIWNYWNKADIAIPFSGVFPKGEIGINPAYTGMDYKIFEAKASAEDSRYVEIVKPLQIEIVPRLIELNKSFMRAGGHYSLKNQDKHSYA